MALDVHGRAHLAVPGQLHSHLRVHVLTDYERFSTVGELIAAELDAIGSEYPRYNLTHNGRRDR